MKIKSYAKINLTLDILGKRNDGYHEIETIFQQINLSDDIELIEIPEDKIRIECNVKPLADENNIAYKAAKIIKDRYNIKKGILIKIDKRIPIGAGLSGGSSNAAAVLKGLNSLWNIGLSKDPLMQISKELGMDVAFHILSGTCKGSGRGEILEKMHDLPKMHVVVVFPGFQISSRDAYAGLDYEKIGKRLSSRKFNPEKIEKYLHNDFECSINKKYPEIEQLKKELGENSTLSGSGSCVFRLFFDKASAEKTAEKLKEKYKEVFLCETFNRKIGLDKEMGFCFGVKRAMDSIQKQGKGIYVLGKLIHNPQVIERLEHNGVKIIENTDGISGGTIVISAHGVPDQTIESIRQKKFNVIDLTCPFVKRVHNITKREEKSGRKIIIFGDKNHTEIKGIVGNLTNYKVIRDGSELTPEDLACDITLVSQTTMETERFRALADKLNTPNVKVIDTICFATKGRQESAIALAKRSDLMVIIGGKISSNTLRLKEACSKYCQTIHIETEKELDPVVLMDKERIGVSAGASTPDWIIQEVIKKIEALI